MATKNFPVSILCPTCGSAELPECSECLGASVDLMNAFLGEGNGEIRCLSAAIAAYQGRSEATPAWAVPFLSACFQTEKEWLREPSSILAMLRGLRENPPKPFLG